VTNTCPTEAELRELLLGRGPESIGEHLLECPHCGASAGRLVASDPLLADLRAAHDTSEIGTDGTFVEELLRRVRQPASKPMDRELDFLDPPLAEFPNDLGRFNHYRIVERIGQGGMGMVFKAVDTTLERTVALKIILPKYAENTKLRDRFLEEARATVKVRSPHVAEVYATDVWRNVPYLTMELLVGTTLDKRPKPMALDALRRIGFSIAKGLADAHRAGMIHRDLKPSNIHLGTDSRTGKPTVKLIDFGLARPVNREIEITKSGELLGTPAYMSPEQARGKKVDHRTDLYSLGVILHQLATGKLPYDSADEGVMAILTELATPEPLTSVAKRTEKLPPSLAKLIDRLLAKDPANRPASADEVMKILKGSLNEKVDPNTSSNGTAVVASEPFVSISDSTGPYEPSMVFSEMKTEADAPPPKPARRWVWPTVGVGVAVAALVVAILAGAFNVKVKTKDGPVIELADLPDDAEVTVDGEVVQVTWNEGKTKAEVRVKPGTRTIEVKKDGFRVTGEEITLAEGERKPFTVRLEKLELGEKPAAQAIAAAPKIDIVESAELVENGNAEDRLKGWESKDGNWNVMGPEIRDPFFRPGRCKSALLQQDVDVSRFAADIDAGLVEFKFSGLISCYSKGQKDKASLRLVFLDTDKKELGTGYDTGFVHAPVWKEYGGTPKPKVGTRYVRIILHSRRDNTPGNYENSGYYDNISLKALTTKLPANFAKLRPAVNGSTVQFFGTGFLPQADFVTGPEAYANVLMMGVSTDSQTFIDAARRASRTVVLLFQGKSRDGIETSLYPIIEKNRDTVAGVFWSLPYANGYDPAAVATFGRELKQKFPELTYLVSFVEKPNGKHETKPVPEEVDVVVVTNYFDKTPANVQAKTDDCMPVWAAKAGGRPIYLLWTNWDNNATGIVPSTQPGTFRACLEAAKKHRIAGLLFHSLYSGATGGMKSIDANPPLYQELVEVGRAIGGANGATGPNAPSGLVASAPSAGNANDRNRFNVRKGQWSIIGDELAQTDAGEHYALLEFGDENWTDYDYQVDVKRVQGGDQAALLYRWTSPSNFNLFGIGTSGNSFVVVEWQKDGQMGFLNNFNYRLNNNQWYTMIVKVRGNRMTCELRHGADKVRSWVADSDRHPKGKVGLRTVFSHMRFKNIKVTAPDGTVLWDGLPNIGGAPATAQADYTNSLGMKFVRVPKGRSWLSGASYRDGDREVNFPDDYYLGQFEVTQAEWRKVMGKNPSHFSKTGEGKDAVKNLDDATIARLPVEMVSWNDCQEFLTKLNEQAKETGWTYRLPTWEEWEYACRGGPMKVLAESRSNFYLAGPINSLTALQANYRITGLARTAPVGSYPPNKLGLYDMHGNVWEYLHDAVAPDLCKGFGNSWNNETHELRNAWGSPIPRSSVGSNMGLRVVRVPATPKPASARTVDLLALVDVTRDAVKGTWTRGPDGISSDNSAFCRIKIPYQPLPAEYDYRVEFTAKGGGNDVLQLLSAGGTSFSFLMGAWGGKWDGFDAVTGHPLTRDGTNIIGGPTSIKRNTRHTVVISVRKDSVSATIDGKLVVKHATNYADLRMPDVWKIGDGLLGLGTTIDPTTFHKAELVDVTAVAVAPAPVPSPTDGFVSLFNGTDRTGWMVDGGDANQWTIENGTIVGRRSKDDKTGRNFFLVDRDFSDFTLRFEFQVGDDTSLGAVALRAEVGEMVPFDDQQQIFDHPTIKLTNPAHGGLSYTGSANWLMSSKQYILPKAKPKVVVGQWHSVEVTVKGDTCSASFDGVPCVDLKLDPTAPTPFGFVPALKRAKGKVGFQINTGTMRYRNISIKESSPAAPALVANPKFTPLFNGKDLTGWQKSGFAQSSWKIENGELVGTCPVNAANEGGVLSTNRKDYRNFHLRLQAIRSDVAPKRLGNRLVLLPGPKDVGANGYLKIPLGRSEDDDGRELGRVVQTRNDRYPLLAKSNIAPDEWYSLDTIVQGNRVWTLVNGVTTTDAVDAALPAGGGAITLIVGQGATLRVRKIEIRELKPNENVVLPEPVKTSSPAVAPIDPKTPAKDPKLSALFNGKDLNGWEALGNTNATWKVENGELVGGWKNSDFVGGSTLTTLKKDYRNFRLRVKAQPAEHWASHIYALPGINPTGPGGYLKVWLGTEKGEAGVETGQLTMRESDNAPLLAKAKLAANEWNAIEIVVQGNRVQVFVDGAKTADQTDDRMPAAGHAIGLHLTGGSVLRIRSVEIEELESPAAVAAAKRRDAVILDSLVVIQDGAKGRERLGVVTETGICTIMPGTFKDVQLATVDGKRTVAGTVSSRSPFPFCWIDPVKADLPRAVPAPAGAVQKAQDAYIAILVDGKPEIYAGKLDANRAFTSPAAIAPKQGGIVFAGPIFTADGSFLGLGMRTDLDRPILLQVPKTN
jgi:serine/threonine protein kinase/formylglycine-generating enzyme required for sulfatase activity